MTKLRYILTIYDRNTKTISHLERNSETIDETVEKELGSWTTHLAMTSGVANHPKEFFQTGTTKDNSKCFSILCIEEELEE